MGKRGAEKSNAESRSDLLHPGARTKLRRLTEHALRACSLSAGLPVVESWFADVWTLGEEAVKTRSDWIMTQDVYRIAADQIGKALTKSGKEAKEHSGKLNTILSASSLQETADHIVSFIESLPHSYDVLFPLVSLKLNAGVEINKSLSFVVIDQPKSLGLRLANWTTTPPSGTYLKIRAQGYANGDIENSAYANALRTLKTAIYLGFIHFVFVRDESLSSPRSLAAFLGAGSEPIQNAFATDATAPDINVYPASIPLHVSRLLRQVVWNDGTRSGLSLIPTVVPGRESDALGHALGTPYAALSRTGHEEAAGALLSAMEWGFEAIAEEAPAMSVVKLCIALEAALGEESDSERITERLSDRCAFLLGKTPAGRRAIREEIRSLYRVRSKVVHGKTSAIGPSDLQVLPTGQRTLDQAVRKELAGLSERIE